MPAESDFLWGEVLEQLSQLPGVELQTLLKPVPECDDWCWNDIADRVLHVVMM